jgi:hypothetical protein
MTNVTFTTTKVASDFQSQEQQANFAVGHFTPSFSNTGITVDFQASNIDWTGAIRVSNVVNTDDIITTTPQVSIAAGATSYGLTKVTLSGLTRSDATAVRAFSLITIAGNTDAQGNIFDVPYANFRLSGCTYPVGGNTTTPYANFAISGNTSNAGAGAISSKFFIDISNTYQGYTGCVPPTATTSINYISNTWVLGLNGGNVTVSNNLITQNTYSIWTSGGGINSVAFVEPFANRIFIGGGRSNDRRLYSANLVNNTLTNVTFVTAIANVGTPVQAYSNGNIFMIGIDEGINGVLYTSNGNTWSTLPGNANANIYLTGTHAIDYYANTWSLFFGDLESNTGSNGYYQISNLTSNTLSRVNFNTGRSYYITDAARNGNILVLAGRLNSTNTGIILHNTGNIWQQANLSFVPWGINYIAGNYYAYGGKDAYIADTVGAGPGIIARSPNLVSWSNVVNATNQFLDIATDGNTIVGVGFSSGIGNYWSAGVNSNSWINSFTNAPRSQTLTIPAYDVFPVSNLVLNYGNANTIFANQVVSVISNALIQGNIQEYSISNTQFSNVIYNQPITTTLASGFIRSPSVDQSITINLARNMIVYRPETGYYRIFSTINTPPGSWRFKQSVFNGGFSKINFNPYSSNLYTFYNPPNTNTVVVATNTNYQNLVGGEADSSWTIANVTTLSGNVFTDPPVGVTLDEQQVVQYNTSQNFYRIYSRSGSGNGFVLTQTSNAIPYGNLHINGNVFFGIRTFADAGYTNYYLGLYKRDASNANSYIFSSECNLNITGTASFLANNENYLGSAVLPNANTIVSFLSSTGNGLPVMRRHDYNGNVWSKTIDQVLGIQQMVNTSWFNFEIPVDNANILYTTVGPFPGGSTSVANVYNFASNGGYEYKSTVPNPKSINFKPLSSLSNALVTTSSDGKNTYYHSFPVFNGTRITVDTNQYVGNISPIAFSAVTPPYSTAIDTVPGSAGAPVQQPFTTKQRDLWRYSSNLGVTSYQLPFSYSDNKLNRYMANLAVPGYIYQTQTANTFSLTRTSNGVANINDIINGNITLSDGVSNSTANLQRTAFYLGEILAPNNPPQLVISIANANYSGNLNYSANLASLNNFESLISIPGYTVSTITAGNISVRSNSYGTVSNITANILQDYTQNLFPPNVTRTSYNNGNTAQIPDTNSPTISIDFANAFGYSPDPFVVTLPWNSNANVIANVIRTQSLIGGNITGTGPNVNITATSPGVETQPVITFGGNGSSNLSANNVFYPGSGNVDYMIIANSTFPLPQNANPSQTIVNLLGNYYSDDYQLIRTGATTFALLNIQSGNLVQPQVTTTSNTQSITNISFAPGSNAESTLQDQTIDLGQARARISNIILLS